jgi:hypothetical protein
VLSMVRLAWRNVARDWTHSLLAVAGMIVASAVMTFALTLSGTWHSSALARHRFVAGGDIVALPARMPSSADRLGRHAAATDVAWELRWWDSAWRSNLDEFAPDLGQEGYLAPAGAADTFAIDLPEDERRSLARAGVKDVYPYLCLPAFSIGTTGEMTTTPLRARRPEADLAWTTLPDSGIELLAGRPLTPDDEGKPVAVVSYIRPRGAGPTPRLGSVITVRVPGVTLDADGRPTFDYTRMRAFEFEVVGFINVLREVETSQNGQPGSAPGNYTQVSIMWELDEIMIPTLTFDRVHREVAGGKPPAVTGQLGLVVEDMTRLGRTKKALVAAFPDWTFLTAPELASLQTSVRGAGTALPADLSGLFAGLLFLLAGTLMAGNMYVLVAQRAKQIGILKSIGATRLDVCFLVLWEVAGYALVGGVIGFLGVAALNAVVLLTSGVLITRVLAQAGVNAGVVLASTVLVAMIFGVGPAWLAAGLPPARSLRSE